MNTKFRITKCNVCGHICNNNEYKRCFSTGCRGYYEIYMLVEDKTIIKN